MNDIPNSTWNEQDASNTAPVPNGAPEGWFPSDVNNVYRMGMGATKRFWDHLNITETTTGTATAYLLNYDVAPQSLWNGELFGFILNLTCGPAPTLNVNALGGKTLRRFDGSAWIGLTASDIKANQVLVVYYNSSSGTYDIVAGFRDPSFSGGTLTSTTSMSGAAFNEAKGTDIASAATVNIGAANGNYIVITGTTMITAFDSVQAGTERVLEFAGILTLTQNATSLILPTGANITTAAGDVATFRSEGSGNWRCVDYQRANGTALAPLLTAFTNSISGDVALNDTSKYFDGPTVAQGTTGTWLATGTVTLQDTAASGRMLCKLWDGTTVIASGEAYTPATANVPITISLSGYIASPAGNIRISCRDAVSASGLILFNSSGNSKDSTISAVRIA